MRIMQIAAGVLFATLIAHAAHANTNDIQMLPPVDFVTEKNTCTVANAGVLYWDGVHPMNCIPGFMGDANGNVTIGGNLAIGEDLTLNGVGPLTSNHATALLQLFAANCGSSGNNYQVLTRTNGVIQCTGVTDILNQNGIQMGQTMMSACPAGTVLTSTDGLTFTCVGLTVAACPNGQVLTGVTNGQPVCTALTFDCPAGQVLQSVNGGTPTCSASGPNYPACGGVPSTISIEEYDGLTPQYVCNAICPAGSATYATANGSYYFGVNQALQTLNYPAATAIGQIEPPDAVTWQGTTYGGPSFSDGCGSVWYIQCTATGWKTVPSPSSSPNEFCPSGGPAPDGGPG